MSRARPAVGLVTHLAWGSDAQVHGDLRQIRSGGVRHIREDFPWEIIEPSRGSFDWSWTDELLTAAARNGVDVLPILDYSAPWASSDPSGAGDTHHPPTDPQDYADFAAAVVARYGSNGTFWLLHPELPRQPIRAVEIWNEPWYHGFWSSPNPGRYASLVRTTATAVRAIDAGIMIAASGDLSQSRADHSSPPWVDTLLTIAPDLVDIVSAWAVHPYPIPMRRSPDSTSGALNYDRVALVHDVLRSHGVTAPIWITEVGWSSAPESEQGVSEMEQAVHTERALAIALERWSTFVERVYVYSWFRSTGDPRDSEGNFGLMRADESLKPAWDVITAYAAESDTVSADEPDDVVGGGTTPTPPPSAPSSSPPETTPPRPVTGTFSDVDGSVHESAIEALVMRGVTDGCVGDGHRFCPNQSITRGQMATFLVRALLAVGVVLDQEPERDTFRDHGGVHDININLLATANIIYGYDDGTFRPGAPVSRGDMAMLLQRGFRIPVAGSNPFVDVAGRYSPAVDAIVTAGITQGCAMDGPRFCPRTTVTRAQMASFVARSMDWYDRAAVSAAR